jgi:hypothetical protein
VVRPEAISWWQIIGGPKPHCIPNRPKHMAASRLSAWPSCARGPGRRLKNSIPKPPARPPAPPAHIGRSSLIPREPAFANVLVGSEPFKGRRKLPLAPWREPNPEPTSSCSAGCYAAQAAQNRSRSGRSLTRTSRRIRRVGGIRSIAHSGPIRFTHMFIPSSATCRSRPSIRIGCELFPTIKAVLAERFELLRAGE